MAFNPAEPVLWTLFNMVLLFHGLNVRSNGVKNAFTTEKYLRKRCARDSSQPGPERSG
jgi:hypothetical protein